MSAKKKVNPLTNTTLITYADEKKPTLRQYLKQTSAEDRVLCSNVNVIWFPRQWANYTVETEHFRVSFKEGSQGFSLLSEYLDEFTKGTVNLRITISGERGEVIGFSEGSVSGEWFFISDMGIKFTPDAE